MGFGRGGFDWAKHPTPGEVQKVRILFCLFVFVGVGIHVCTFVRSVPKSHVTYGGMRAPTLRRFCLILFFPSFVAALTHKNRNLDPRQPPCKRARLGGLAVDPPTLEGLEPSTSALCEMAKLYTEHGQTIDLFLKNVIEERLQMLARQIEQRQRNIFTITTVRLAHMKMVQKKVGSEDPNDGLKIAADEVGSGGDGQGGVSAESGGDGSGAGEVGGPGVVGGAGEEDDADLAPEIARALEEMMHSGNALGGILHDRGFQ